MSSTSASTSTAPGPHPGGGGPGSSRVLGPAWYRGGGGHGNRGFQPPPAVSSEGRNGDEQHNASEGKNNINGGKDNDGFQHVGSKDRDKKSRSGSFSSRSEGLLNSSGGGSGSRGGSSYSRASSAAYTGTKKSGRSLADLVASKPHTNMSRTQSSGANPYRSSNERGTTSGGGDRNNDDVDKKVIRYTREKLLSLRPQPGEGMPSYLKHLLSTVVLSDAPQEPVCFDDFDADEIWAQPSSRGPRGTNPPGLKPSSIRALSDRNESGENRQNGAGRWQRGVALPSERDKRHGDANAPEDLWDDPVTTMEDLSQYGGPIDDLRRPRQNSVASNNSDTKPSGQGPLYDWKDISDAASLFDKEIHGDKTTSSEEKEEDEDGKRFKAVDTHKPLASEGTTILSGSGNGVSVFEDFGEPTASEPSSPPTPTEPSEEKNNETSELSASSRLMQMIGMPVQDETTSSSKLITSWGSSNADDAQPTAETSSFGNVGGFISTCPSSSVPKNPWGTALGGTPLGGTAIPSEPAPMTSSEGFDLSARLEAAVANQKSREAKAMQEAAVEDQRRRETEQQRQQQELLRRQKEEEDEAQRIQALLRAQISAQHAAAQQVQARQAAEAQRQAAAAQAVAAAGRVQYNSQVETILLERISTVLENSWGRADLMNILSTLHMEDSRVIPLLGSIDALKALLSRHPQRFAVAKEPQYGVDVAMLHLSNAQWNQQKAQQEEIQRQQHMQAAQAAAQAQVEAKVAQTAAQAPQPNNVKVTNAPWFYADPQGNIQGPFGGEEMRQWLDAGYFKGDLPISQNPKGPFRSLLSIFPDPPVAFHVNQSPEGDGDNMKEPPNSKILADTEKVRPEKESPVPIPPVIVKEESEPEKPNTPLPEIANSLSSGMPPSDQNASSVQLKLLLGLGSANKPSNNESKIESTINNDVAIAGPPPVKEPSPMKEEKVEPSPPEIVPNPPQPKRSSKKEKQTKNVASAPIPIVAKPPSPTPVAPPLLPTAPAPVAWGGAAASKVTRKKSMSEIQQEEARVSAILARQNQSLSRNSSGGWANVAAAGGGSSGWSSGTVKQSVASGLVSAAPQATKTSKSQQQMNQKQLPQQQANQQRSNAQSKAVDDFGASMTPALESWCKDKMQKLTGSDDLTLISFCMTLNDPVEIRQYLAAYLGSTPEVSNFANEFIHRKGGNKSSQEEWESADKAKKSRKKKSLAK